MDLQPSVETPVINIDPYLRDRRRQTVDHFLHLLEKEPDVAAKAVEGIAEVENVYVMIGTERVGRHTFEDQVIQSVCSILANELVPHLVVDPATQSAMQQAKEAHDQHLGHQAPPEQADFVALKALMSHVAAYSALR